MLHRIAAVLIERERIDGDEFNILYDGGELPPVEAVKPETPAQPENNGTEEIHRPNDGNGPQDTSGV
jgi:hypothetical protein